MVDRGKNPEPSVGDRVGDGWRVVLPLEDATFTNYRVHRENIGDAELILIPAEKRLEALATKLANVRHENLVAIYEAGDYLGRTYFVREMVMGQTVSEWLARDRRLGYDPALGIACQLCLASIEAAKHGVDFLALGPGVVKVTPDGFVKADPLKLLDKGESDPYRSPEEIRGRRPDGRSDLFRIGLLIYEMLLGSKPVRYKDGSVEFLPLTQARSDVSTVLDAVVMKALSDIPSDRYRDANRLLDDLHPLLMHRPAPASAAPSKWHEDSRFWLYVAVALGALALVISFMTGILRFPF